MDTLKTNALIPNARLRNRDLKAKLTLEKG